MLNGHNTKVLCTVLKRCDRILYLGPSVLMGKILSWTFMVMLSSKVAKQWRYIVHLLQAILNTKCNIHHALIPETISRGRQWVSARSIHLSELSTLLLLFYRDCPCLLFKQEATISFVMSVCPSARNSAPNGRIFMKFDIFFSKLSRENSSFTKTGQE